MANITNLESFLGDVAQAIKNKKGTTDPIPAANFDTEIESIESGTVLDTLSATADTITDEDANIKFTSGEIGEKIVLPETGIAEISATKTRLAQTIGVSSDKLVYGENILGITGTSDVNNILYSRIKGIKNDTVLVSGTTRSNNIDTQIGSYVYAVVWYRASTETLLDVTAECWTLISNTIGGLAGSSSQNIAVLGKIATSTTETISVTITDAVNVSIFMVACTDAHSDIELVTTSKALAKNTLGFVRKGDIIVCSS